MNDEMLRLRFYILYFMCCTVSAHLKCSSAFLSKNKLCQKFQSVQTFFLIALISNQKTLLHRFLWANVLSQLAVV